MVSVILARSTAIFSDRNICNYSSIDKAYQPSHKKLGRQQSMLFPRMSDQHHTAFSTYDFTIKLKKDIISSSPVKFQNSNFVEQSHINTPIKPLISNRAYTIFSKKLKTNNNKK
ncbi:hypothetical protein Q4508_00880 [Amphritea sp. 2_MG-2023]|uniref:hypothetical protein n=1 Tax=Amphritea TaxID=515417 RepID=UPI001C06A7C8|nr:MULTISPECIES: hypothetical protein [Amphritea]MBU2964710.1 hypothetical protein [Amphritea atlantica]MDO6417107.1 hypothetical protein [Amphritea sp. 2_MG-2023]